MDRNLLALCLLLIAGVGLALAASDLPGINDKTAGCPSSGCAGKGACTPGLGACGNCTCENCPTGCEGGEGCLNCTGNCDNCPGGYGFQGACPNGKAGAEKGAGSNFGCGGSGWRCPRMSA